MDSNEIIYQYLGVDYQLNHWRINAMLSRADSGLRTIKNGYTGYLSLAYKMNRLTPYWRVSYSRFHAPEQLAINLPEAWQAFILTEFQDAQSDQINHALGLRYDVNEHLAIKAQVNHIHSKVNPTFLWNYETEQWAQRANFFSLVVDVSF